MSTGAKKRLGVLISGGGSNLQAILDACSAGEIFGEVAVVVSSNSSAFGLERAKGFGVATAVCARLDYADCESRDRAVLDILTRNGVDYVILAGYLGILTGVLVNAYPNRILNIHPALLPKFGGKDFHGLNVHRAVLEAGEVESGATVHFVDGGVDTGLVVASERLAVLPSDTPQSLQKRILTEIEHPLLVKTVAALCAGRLWVKDGKVHYEQ